LQVAEDLANLASKHAHDKKYPSPYSQEAIKQGIDIPWILKIANASFSDGKFRLGHMKASSPPHPFITQCASRRQLLLVIKPLLAGGGLFHVLFPASITFEPDKGGWRCVQGKRTSRTLLLRIVEQQ